MSDGRAHLAQAHIGKVLRGKWRLDALLGIGAMAAVYAATHRNGMRAAVKLLHPELGADPKVRTRFLREGYAANKIDHPGCVAVLDDEVAEDGSVFLVMELLIGETLDERAERRGGRLPVAEVVAAGDQLLDALAAAHAKGIVHRDIKPANLFITREGAVKVLDFGLARLLENEGATVTMTGSAMGTPAFMPPEQALAEWDKVDGRSDIWAVGATLFTLLTGRFVHETESVTALLVAISSRPVQPLGSVMPELPPGIAAVIDRALAFRPADRWPDARAMQAALRAAAKVLPEAGPGGIVPASIGARLSLPDNAPPSAMKGTTQASSLLDATVTRPYTRKRPRTLVLIAAAAAVAGGAALFGLLGRDPTPEVGSQTPTATSSASQLGAAGDVVSPAPPAPPPTASASAVAPVVTAAPSGAPPGAAAPSGAKPPPRVPTSKPLPPDDPFSKFN